MVVLKKIKASTLMETLVASVLIVIVFMITSMILNNLFSNSIKTNTRDIEAHINELQYLYKSEKLTIPYFDDFKNWNIKIHVVKEQNVSKVLLQASNIETQQDYLKEIYANE